MLCTRSATLTLEGSDDQAAIAQTVNVIGTGLQTCSLPALSKFYRISYVNGGTADTMPIQLAMQTIAVGALDVEAVRATGLTGAITLTRYVGGTAGGAPVTGPFLSGDWIVDNSGAIYICTVAGTPGTWVQPAASSYSGVFTAQGFATTGLTGATAAVRWVGGTTTGAPVSGTFAVGDFVTTRDGAIYICTAAGTPGTWTVANAATFLTIATAASTYAPIASPTFTGVVTGPTLKVSGTTGAATATRVIGANASGAPASGTWLAGDVATGVDGHLFVCTVGGTPGTWQDTGLVGGSLAAATSASTLAATGLTGATQTGRWAGVTTSGAPVSGTFAVGDWVTTRNGHMWGCTAAGTPGTWVDMGAYGSGGGTTPGSWCQLSNSTGQNILNATETAVTFDQEVFDQLGWHTGGNPSRVTPTIAGDYEFYFSPTWFESQAVPSGNRRTFIKKNNSTYHSDSIIIAGSFETGQDVTVPPSSGIVTMNGTTDYLEARVSQSSGVTLSLDGTNRVGQAPCFLVRYLGATS